MTAAPLLDYAERQKFHGVTFDQERDGPRLTAQAVRVFNIMRLGNWHTLASLSMATGDPQASVSARIRDLRKHGYVVERAYVSRGLWRYRLVNRVAS